MTDVMRVALGQHSAATHDYLTFAKQLGVGSVQFNMIGKGIGIDQIPKADDLPEDKGYLDASYLKTVEAEGQRLRLGPGSDRECAAAVLC